MIIISLFQYIVKIHALLSSFLLFFLFYSNVANANYTYEELSKKTTKEIYDSLEWKNILHYDDRKSVINSNSDFFLSSDGYINPKSEYEATLKSLTNEASLNDKHTICMYPARFNYIVSSLNLSKELFPKPNCKEYEEYKKNVLFENVYIVFASENNFSPSSMMGHTFLKIDGGEKSHAFSYFAALNNADSIKFYIDILTSGIDGAYILSPYIEKSSEYLYKEQRSLWEFKLDLNDKDKIRLKEHLWELKEKNIKYSLLSHNCNTALISILKVANKDFSVEAIKPFITPVEYIQKLHDDNKISDISIEPTTTQRTIIEKFGLNFVGNAPKPARLSISQDLSNDFTNVNISPVYQDIRDISNAYFPDLESKMFDLSINYNSTNKKIIFDKVDILKMKSVIDYPSTKSLSKYFRLGFENDLFNEETELKPVVEFGLGTSKKISTTSVYILPKIGYHYDNYSNFYLSSEIGAISRIGDNIKIINSYEKYLNSKDTNIGFNEKYNFYI